MSPDHPDSLRQQIALVQARLAALGPVMRGSVTHMGRRHQQAYFSTSVGGKTKVIYLGAQRHDQARRCVANFHQLLALVEELTVLRMQLLKQDPTAQL